MKRTTSASCSMAPDSRRSANCGLRSSRSGASQLAQDEHGNFQFLGEPLEGTGNTRNFFVAIAKTTARGDKLQIINDDKIETLVALQAPRFRAHLHHGG